MRETLNIKNLHEKHREEIIKLYEAMDKSQNFADYFKTDFFRDKIIDWKITQDSNANFWERYKDMYLSFPIRYTHFHSDKDMYKWHITNYIWEYNERLFFVYVNTYCLFDMHYREWLDEIWEGIFFYDKLNANYYLRDTEVEDFLEKLYQWYTETNSRIKEIRKEEMKAHLEKQLEELNK